METSPRVLGTCDQLLASFTNCWLKKLLPNNWHQQLYLMPQMCTSSKFSCKYILTSWIWVDQAKPNSIYFTINNFALNEDKLLIGFRPHAFLVSTYHGDDIFQPGTTTLDEFGAGSSKIMLSQLSTKHEVWSNAFYSA